MLNNKNYAIMKTYQILFKGMYTNKLSLVETKDYKVYKETLNDILKGKYKNLLLINTNICDETI